VAAEPPPNLAHSSLHQPRWWEGTRPKCFRWHSAPGKGERCPDRVIGRGCRHSSTLPRSWQWVSTALDCAWLSPGLHCRAEWPPPCLSPLDPEMRRPAGMPSRSMQPPLAVAQRLDSNCQHSVHETTRLLYYPSRLAGWQCCDLSESTPSLTGLDATVWLPTNLYVSRSRGTHMVTLLYNLALALRRHTRGEIIGRRIAGATGRTGRRAQMCDIGRCSRPTEDYPPRNVSEELRR
jgi:hypothetical protein